MTWKRHLPLKESLRGFCTLPAQFWKEDFHLPWFWWVPQRYLKVKGFLLLPRTVASQRQWMRSQLHSKPSAVQETASPHRFSKPLFSPIIISLVFARFQVLQNSVRFDCVYDETTRTQQKTHLPLKKKILVLLQQCWQPQSFPAWTQSIAELNLYPAISIHASPVAPDKASSQQPCYDRRYHLHLLPWCRQIGITLQQAFRPNSPWPKPRVGVCTCN